MGFGLGLGLGPNPQQQPPRPPKRENWETVGDQLGEGGQGKTFLVRRKGSGDAGKLFVLKELKHQGDVAARKRMYREVAALQSLSESGLPKVIESNVAPALFEDSTPLYVVLEYVEGDTLDKKVRNGVASLDQALLLTRRLAKIVEYCHARQVIHRDIKPGNIVLRGGEWSDPVIIDFGLSFNWNSDAEELTEVSEQLGNSFLRLPEFQSRENDKRSHVADTTCVAGVLLYAISGKKPATLLDEAHLKPHERAAFKTAFDAFDEGTRDRVNLFFGRAFSQHASRRWQSAEQLLEALEKLASVGEGAGNSGVDSVLAAFADVVESQTYDFDQVASAYHRITTDEFRKALHGFEKYYTLGFSQDKKVYEQEFSLKLVLNPKYRRIPILSFFAKGAIEEGLARLGITVFRRNTMPPLTELVAYDVDDPLPEGEYRRQLTAYVKSVLEDLSPGPSEEALRKLQGPKE